ncbi:hypothetical protein ABZ746_16000 [Streptomyces sp. NPDC020096]
MSAAVGSALLTGLMASNAPTATAAAPPQQAQSVASSGISGQAQATTLASLRHHVEDLTVGTPDGTPLGQPRLYAVYHDLSQAGVTNWTVVGPENPARSTIVLRLWKTDAQHVRAVRAAIAPTLRAEGQSREVYSAGILAAVRPGSPAARGDATALTRLVSRLDGVQATVDPQPDTVYVHLEGEHLTAPALTAVRDETARTAGSSAHAVRVVSEP